MIRHCNLQEKVMVSSKYFQESFKSLQLIGFTVLYYNFNFSTEELNQFNEKVHQRNYELLDTKEGLEMAEKKIESVWGKKIESIGKEVPYRARIKMLGGLPKKKMLMDFSLYENLRATESYLVLTFSALMELKNWNKVQMDLFWSNLKDNCVNYANGMTNEFIVDYFINEIGVEFGESD